MTETLIKTIYEASLDDRLWRDVARTLEDQFGGISSAMVFATPEKTFLQHTNVDDAVTDIYNEHQWANDLWMQRFDQTPPGGVCTGRSLAPLSEVDPAYVNDILNASGVTDSLASKLIHADGFMGCFSIYRPEGGEIFSRSDTEAMAKIAPHLSQSIIIRHQFGDLAARIAELEGLLRDQSDQMFILDEKTRVIWANPSAERALSENAALRTRQGRLTVDDRYKVPMRAAVGRASSGLAASAVVGTDADNAPVVLHISPVSEEIGARLGGFAYRNRIRGDCLLLAVVRSASVASAELRRMLADYYGLTPRETDISMLVADGMNVPEAANHLGVSKETARDHLNSALSKTGAQRQTMLVKLINKLAN